MPRLLADTTPLRVSPEFRRLWWGLGLSNLGSQLTVVAVGLEVYDLSGSTLSVGILGICALVPLVVLGLYGGSLVDAHDRRRVAIVSATAAWVVTCLLALQAWRHVGSVPLLYALVALQSAAFAVNNPARSAIVPQLLPARLLPAANSLQTIAWNLAVTIGPLLGATLVAVWDYSVAYALDAVTFAAALWALVHLPPQREDGSTHRAGLASVLEGLRFLTTRPNVRMTFLVDLAAMVLAQPRVLFPAVGAVVIGGGAQTTGAMTAAAAVGSLLAGVFSGPLGRVHAQGRAIAWAVAGWGVAISAFGGVLVMATRVTGPRPSVLWPALAAAAVCLAVAGAADAVSAVFRTTILQSATPDAMRGRLQGVFLVVVAGGPRLGDLLGGAGATWWGEGVAAVVGGIACVGAVAVLMRRQPRFLAYDARDPQP
ncbi:MFS transporter [Cellulomonas sp. P24]|uniref:MFS transporter n=1 Tax=Cellulomonas sp. P24 TaxID=2885206 RepID=UPI00216AB68D|nr:MFS transporter [Cellulomonas sp. P24]MCR6492963.1 MFS transporter [Cellulomonas sp. P24]